MVVSIFNQLLCSTDRNLMLKPLFFLSVQNYLRGDSRAHKDLGGGSARCILWSLHSLLPGPQPDHES